MSRERESSARGSMRDAARRRATETSHGGGGYSINLPEGTAFFKNDGKKVEFDVIPYTVSDRRNPDVIAGRLKVGDMTDARMYWQHSDIGSDQKPYICLKTVGQRCPICEAHAAMAKNPKADSKDVKALKSKMRMLYNVIDAADSSGKVMVWDVSYYMFTKQLENEQREVEEYYGYADPDAGYTLRIRFEEKLLPGSSKPFYKADRIDFDKRKALSDADLKAAVDLDAALKILTYEQLDAVFLGVDGEPAGEAEPTPAADPAPRSTRGARETAQPAETEQPARRQRAAEPVGQPAPTRGRQAEDKIHSKDPDVERAAGKHAVDPDQDCPGGGVFGRDESQLDHCNDCSEDKWKACRNEKDRLAKEKTKPAEEPRRGRR